MTSSLTKAVVVLALVCTFATTLFIRPTPVSAQSWTETACPTMTDSIERLYRAYFGRGPDHAGFNFWVRASSSGGWGLERISGHFQQSAEFQRTYGQLNNHQFVDLVYRQVLGRPTDGAGRAFWIGELDRGHVARGRVMLFFSESAEHVARTQTMTPLAGTFSWYPEGTRWSCGFGSATIPVGTAASPANTRLDTRLLNVGSGRLDTTVTVRSSPASTRTWTENLRPGWFAYAANIRLDGQTTAVEITAPAKVQWIVVNYPSTMSPSRPGWE